jgi:hypothetical protein
MKTGSPSEVLHCLSIQVFPFVNDAEKSKFITSPCLNLIAKQIKEEDENGLKISNYTNNNNYYNYNGNRWLINFIEIISRLFDYRKYCSINDLISKIPHNNKNSNLKNNIKNNASNTNEDDWKDFDEDDDNFNDNNASSDDEDDVDFIQNNSTENKFLLNNNDSYNEPAFLNTILLESCECFNIIADKCLFIATENVLKMKLNLNLNTVNNEEYLDTTTAATTKNDIEVNTALLSMKSLIWLMHTSFIKNSNDVPNNNS